MKSIEYGAEGTPESMRIVEHAAPVARAGEILIDVHYAGVNRPDVMQRMGKYPPPPDASPVLGLEVAGTVAALGAGVTQWKPGDRVCALTPGGGYAQQCVAPADHALPVPSQMSWEQAAAFPENWFTVWANLIDLAALSAGERLLVHGGTSGIGLAALQLARRVGAEVIVTAGSDAKCRFCLDVGATLAINYRTEDFVARIREATAKQGVDVILDMVAGSYIPKNISLLRPRGRLVFIAFLQGSRAEVDFTAVMVRRLKVMGSTMRPRTVPEKAAIRDALAPGVWPDYVAGKLKSHVHQVFDLDQVAEAHRLMESSQHIGKILLRVPR